MRADPRPALRLAFGANLGATLLWAGAALSPASAQVQQYNPNAANESLARQGEVRALQQQRVSDFNVLNMQAQRNVQYRPHAPAGGIAGLRRSGGYGGLRARARSGFDTGVCVGC